MSELDDIEAVAGEYVLGTLDAAERAEVTARREREPALDRAIRRWERDFAPLIDAGADVAPPADLFRRIEARLGPASGSRTAADPGDNVIALRRRVNRWRSVAALTSALAASLLLVVVWQGMLRREDTRLVAVLQKDFHLAGLSRHSRSADPDAHREAAHQSCRAGQEL